MISATAFVPRLPDSSLSAKPAPSTSLPTTPTTGEGTSRAPGETPSTDTTPTAKPPASSTSGSPTGDASPPTTGGPSDGTRKSPVEQVASFLPADGRGKVTREDTEACLPPYTRHPLSGLYLVTKDGKSSFIVVKVVDPEVSPDQPTMTVTKAKATDYCAPTGEGEPNTDCTSENRTDGSLLKTWESQPYQVEPGAPQTTGSFHAAVWYPGGRTVELSMSRGTADWTGHHPPMAATPMSTDALTAMVRSSTWFRP